MLRVSKFVIPDNATSCNGSPRWALSFNLNAGLGFGRDLFIDGRVGFVRENLMQCGPPVRPLLLEVGQVYGDIGESTANSENSAGICVFVSGIILTVRHGEL